MLRSALRFDGRFLVNLPPASVPNGNEITISFWAYGSDYLPSNGSVFCAKEPAGNRVVNIHLPWGDGCVYFDCGSYGNIYDRIAQQAQPSDYKGKWTHWAFTKNAATGEMNIYLNGNLWLSDRGKRYPLASCQEFVLGTYPDGMTFYDYQGMLSEFQIWNRARTAAEIKATMSTLLRGNEPGLVAYWPLDEGSGNIVRDRTNHGYHGTIDSPDGLGAISWVQTEIPLQPAGIGSLPKKPNILILLNDQDSAAVASRWPQSFEDEHLPAIKRLKKNGITFKKAFTATAACSPSRAAMLTSTYPQENGVVHTISAAASTASRTEADLPAGYTQDILRPTQLNIAHMLKAAGYKVFWKGKWHLGHSLSGTEDWVDADIEYMKTAYGFDGWIPGDAGTARADFTKFGMGTYKNDIRYVDGSDYPGFNDLTPDVKAAFLKAESARQFIRNYNPENGPFCLIVSIVNPHDIHCAPHFETEAGYREEDFASFDMPIPENVNEDLSTKPEIHEIWKRASEAKDNQRAGRIKQKGDRLKAEGKLEEAQKQYDKASPNLSDPKAQKMFVNFYAYLKKLADQHMNNILNELDLKGLTENTLIIRTADHGEMCLNHGMREKPYNAYEETINIPLVISNPKLFPTPQETNTLVSTLDIMPTLAKIVGVYDMFKFAFRGCELTPLFTNPQEKIYDSCGRERDYIHFTFDDGFLPERFKLCPLYIRTIRTSDWKYSVYFNPNGNKFEYEMYDLKNDPHENNNIIGVARYWDQQKFLHEKLAKVMIENGTVPTPYWIYTEQMQKTSFLPPLYWPLAPEAVLNGRMQYEANKAQQKFRKSTLIQSQVAQVPVDMWWVG